MPFFARALGVGSVFALIVAPALAAASVLLFAEATGRADLFAGSMPGYESLLEFFGRGVVVMVLCGALGVIAEVSATAARKAPQTYARGGSRHAAAPRPARTSLRSGHDSATSRQRADALLPRTAGSPLRHPGIALNRRRR